MTDVSATQPAVDGSASAVEPETPDFARPSPWVFQYRVIKALVLREMATRHGASRLGYLLTLMMPIITIATLILMFGFRGKVIPSGFPLGVFVVTGYPLWQSFQGFYTKAMGTASRGDPLLMFPQITQLDLIYSSLIVEWATGTVVFIILCIGVCVIFNSKGPADPLGVLLCLWGCMWLGSAMGMILCGLQRTLPLVATFLNVFMRFGMWVSGVLYTINKLPPVLWPYLRWNPILHLIEGCRFLWKPRLRRPDLQPGLCVRRRIRPDSARLRRRARFAAVRRMSIEMINISKTFTTLGRRRTVFRNFNLMIPKGLNLGVIGPNGSGK